MFSWNRSKSRIYPREMFGSFSTVQGWICCNLWNFASYLFWRSIFLIYICRNLNTWTSVILLRSFHKTIEKFKTSGLKIIKLLSKLNRFYFWGLKFLSLLSSGYLIWKFRVFRNFTDTFCVLPVNWCFRCRRSSWPLRQPQRSP